MKNRLASRIALVHDAPQIVVRPLEEMTTDLTSIALTVASSALGAGLVTFWLNSWKAELDFRRAKVEELYASVHKYTLEMQILTHGIRTGRVDLDSASRTFATEDYDRISLLLDLYFPRLHSTFKQFTLALEAFIVQDAQFRTDDKGIAEDIVHIGEIGEKLKGEVVALARERSLRAWIETIQDYDRESSRG